MIQLQDYITDPENDSYNFNMGAFYENQKHYSPASAYYLRCAERTKNIDLRYECLLRMYLCYNNLGGRNATCEGLLRQAVSLCPTKPEAYFFLTQHYESKSDWMNVYTYASIALEHCKKLSLFISQIDFPSLHCLTFQRAAASWWIGKPKEARTLFRSLVDVADTLPSRYRVLLQSNLSQLGSGPESQAIRTYTKDLYSKYKFKFKGLETIDRNYSQVYQDLFILTVLNGKQNGTYLEIGSSSPYKANNTALLEKLFGWYGIGIELNESFIKDYREQRKNPVLCADALLIDYNKLLAKYFPNQNTIDYLQLDIEPPNNTYEALLSIPFDKYRFNVITYEHDYYVDLTRSYRDKSRDYLSKLGYILLVPNVSPDDISPFEDWWIRPEIINNIDDYISKKEINHIESYFLNN
jgi:hypothetical protein